MAYLAQDYKGGEWIYESKPTRNKIGKAKCWVPDELYSSMIELPVGSIEKLIGRKITWEENPVKI
jgi:hypothetical protein